MSVTVTGQKRHLDLNSSTLTTTGNATFAGTITTTSTATGAITLNGGTGVSTTGAFILRQNGDGAGNGMAITSSHSTSHRIWKDASGNLNIGSSSNTDAFKQDITGNITIEGTVSASNLSGTNTGDQDLSGYATTSHNHDDRYYTETEIDNFGFLTSSSTQTKYLRSDASDTTSGTVTSTSALGFKVDSSSAGRIEIEANNNWAYLRLRNNSTVAWDIASYDGGNLEWRPAGSSTNRMTYSSGGNLVVAGSVTANGTVLTGATSLAGLATENYVDTAVANVVNSAPAALDTLNELAAALGDDANFSTTIATSIGTKVSKSGDTITSGGNIGLTINHDDFNEGLVIHRNHADNSPSITFKNNDGQIGILYGQESDDNIYWRQGTSTANRKIWHSGNVGASSGLDADKLDSQHGSYYLDYGNLTNVPSSFTPSQHTQAISTVTGLQTALDAKLALAGGTMTGNLLVNAQLAVNSTTINAANKLEVHGQARVSGTMMIGDSSISNATTSGQLHIKNTGEAIIRLEDSDNDNLAFDVKVNEGEGFVITETIGGQSGGDNNRLVIAESTGNATFSGTITASAGINGLTLANGGISGSNYNISGVNQLTIADPGEGIVFSGGSAGSITLAVVDDTNDDILRITGTGVKLQVGSNEVYHEGHKPTYSEISGTVPTWDQNTTGTAASAPKLTDGGGLSTDPGTAALIHTGQINANVTGNMPASDNSNSIITLNRHTGNYNSQLGFSSNGNLYYRKFSNSTAYTSQIWKTIAFTDNASMLNSNVTIAYGDLTNVPSTFTPAQHTQNFSTITNTPTTLAGYGITDAAAGSHNHAASEITSGTLSDDRLSAGVFRTRSASVVTATDWDTLTDQGTYGAASSAGAQFTGNNRPTHTVGSITFEPDYRYGHVVVTEDNGQGIQQTYYPHSGNQKIFTRTGWNNAGWGGWSMNWNTRNMGSGSGLDADLLDGNQASAFAAALGTDDNYVTDAEKTVIGNTSGTNTGDQDLSGYATETYVNTAVSNLVDSAPGTLNTLNELAAALGDDASFSTTTATALGNRVRVDTASQGLTSTQKSNARTNIGAGTSSFNGVYSSLSSIPSTFTPAQHTHAASDITSGTFGTARIPNLATSKITSGTFANARISESSVTQHVTGISSSQSQKLGYITVTQAVDLDTIESNAAGALQKAGGTMTGDLRLDDGVKAKFGDSADLQIYHDGSNSYVNDAGTGDLIIRGGNDILFQDAVGNTLANMNQANSVELYYGGSAKFATTSSGINVVGAIAVSSTVDGVDIAARDSVLTSTTTTANAALPKSGGTMTGNIFGTTLKVGGASGTNEINFQAGKMEFTSSSTSIFVLTGSELRPSANNAIKLGTSAKKWTEVHAATYKGELDGTINSSTTATTQSQGNNSTKVATTAYVDAYTPTNTQTILFSNFIDSGSSSLALRIPFNTLTETSSNQYYNHMDCPRDGSIKRFRFQNTSGSNHTGFTTELMIFKNGSTTPTGSGELSIQTDQNGGSYVSWDPSNYTFEEGDKLQFAFQKSSSTKTWQGISASIIIEFEQM